MAKYILQCKGVLQTENGKQGRPLRFPFSFFCFPFFVLPMFSDAARNVPTVGCFRSTLNFQRSTFFTPR